MIRKTVSASTELVSTRMYQPRIRISISKAHETSRSAGHWNLKLLTRKGASAPDLEDGGTVLFCSPAGGAVCTAGVRAPECGAGTGGDSHGTRAHHRVA